jgi:hypothetical protein
VQRIDSKYHHHQRTILIASTMFGVVATTVMAMMAQFSSALSVTHTLSLTYRTNQIDSGGMHLEGRQRCVVVLDRRDGGEQEHQQHQQNSDDNAAATAYRKHNGTQTDGIRVPSRRFGVQQRRHFVHCHLLVVIDAFAHREASGLLEGAWSTVVVVLLWV